MCTAKLACQLKKGPPAFQNRRPRCALPRRCPGIEFVVKGSDFGFRTRVWFKVDEFVLRIQHVNLRIVRQLLQHRRPAAPSRAAAQAFRGYLGIRARFCSKADGFVPRIQHVNIRIVRQLISGLAAPSRAAAQALRGYLWVWARFCSKVDGSEPRSQHVNLRIVRQLLQNRRPRSLPPSVPPHRH